MSKLYAGYFVGEFGWEVMKWQAHIRHLAKSYDKIIVGCEIGHDFLYSDFATETYLFEPLADVKRNMWMVNGNVIKLKETLDSVYPSKNICLEKNLKQDFIKYGKFDVRHQYDILIHARDTNNLNTGYRNWPERNWLDVVFAYPTLRIASIGSKQCAKHITGTTDLRDIDLSILADVMVSSEVLLSPSSGPAHFASLCGLKHIVWAADNDRTIHRNEERYKTTWNPLGTEVNFIDGWQPESKNVIKRCDNWLGL